MAAESIAVGEPVSSQYVCLVGLDTIALQFMYGFDWDAGELKNCRHKKTQHLLGF